MLGGAGSRRFVNVDGLRTRVFVHDGESDDDAPTILLIHGAGGNYLEWPPSVRRMAGTRVVALDLPGHGESNGHGYDRICQYAGIVGELANVLGLDRVIAVGHSMGAAIALAYAVEAGETVRGVGVLGCGNVFPMAAELADELRNDFLAATERIVRLSFGPDTPPRRRQHYLERLRRADPDVLYKDFAACRDWDARPYAVRIQAPSLIAAGERDKMIPLSASRALGELMPHSELIVLEGAEHMFLHERAKDVVRLLAGLARRASAINLSNSMG